MESNLETQKNPNYLFINKFEKIKSKLSNILLAKRYCGLCVEYYDDNMLKLDVVFEIIALRQKITLKNVIDNVFNYEPILFSDYICKSCVDWLINSFTLIATAKITAEVLNVYLTSLTEKINACNLETVESIESSHIAMILESTIKESFFPETRMLNKSANKCVEKIEKKLYKCPECNEVFPNYKDLQQHKKAHTKLEYDCNICGKIFKNNESLSTHYTTHMVIKCKLCYKVMNEKDLSDHLKKEHSDAVVECNLCQVAFYNKRALETHVNVSHKKDLQEQCPMCLKRYDGDKDTHKCRFTCPQCNVVQCRHLEYLMSYRDQRLKGGRVKCLHCDYTTNKRETFLGHVNRVHLKYHPYACNLCILKFNSKINLRSHIQRIHKENYICGYCDKQHKEKKDLERHIGYCQLIKRNYACKKCLASFNTNDEIVTHTNLRHSSLNHYLICNKDFSYKTRLNDHIDKSHSGVALTEQTNEDMSQLKKKKVEQPSICETCGKSFTSTDALSSHLKIHAEKVPCPECKKLFNSRKLSVHRKVHLAEKNPILKEKLKQRAKVKCSSCDYITYDYISLDSHINRHHKKIKPYACSICLKEFMGKHHLKRHVQCHTGEKSRKCDLCPKVLANKDCFRMHMRLHTGEKPYSCDICGDKFRSSSIMNVHKNRMHAEKSTECPLCGSMFYNVREFRHHCRNVHWKQKDRKFNYKELQGLKEEHYYLFYDGRTPMMKN